MANSFREERLEAGQVVRFSKDALENYGDCWSSVTFEIEEWYNHCGYDDHGHPGYDSSGGKYIYDLKCFQGSVYRWEVKVVSAEESEALTELLKARYVDCSSA